MESEELSPSLPVNLDDIAVVKERFAQLSSQPEVSNFLLGAAYCGNGSLSLAQGLADHRNGLTKEESGRIVIDALQQLIAITTNAKNDPAVTSQERQHLLLAAASLVDLCDPDRDYPISSWPYFGVPNAVRQTVEQWGEETWKEEWAKATDRMSNSWLISSRLVLANIDYRGTDFVAHCIQSIKRKAIPLPKDVSKPWNHINYLRTFLQQHREPTRWEIWTKQAPRSPYVNYGPNLQTTFTVQISK